MDTDKADKIIKRVADTVDMKRYLGYVGHIRPTTPEALFRRYLFGYASVHTTWQFNVILYRKLQNYEEWLGNEVELRNRIIDSRAGMYNNRTRYIMKFSEFYWDHPQWFWKNSVESWVQYRDRIKDRAPGIGPAKSSFVVEMTYTDTAQVVCSDSHFFQSYGVAPKDVGRISDKLERAMEHHWVTRCRELGLPPVLVRWAAWDILKKSSDSRYWAHVLERVNYHKVLGGQSGEKD